MTKAEGAFLTIGELADELGLPQHILRYWETRFPHLRPLQRSGNRRYYRPADVDLARRINHLLNVEGSLQFTSCLFCPCTKTFATAVWKSFFVRGGHFFFHEAFGCGEPPDAF